LPICLVAVSHRGCLLWGSCECERVRRRGGMTSPTAGPREPATVLRPERQRRLLPASTLRPREAFVALRVGTAVGGAPFPPLSIRSSPSWLCPAGVSTRLDEDWLLRRRGARSLGRS